MTPKQSVEKERPTDKNVNDNDKGSNVNENMNENNCRKQWQTLPEAGKMKSVKQITQQRQSVRKNDIFVHS